MKSQNRWNPNLYDNKINYVSQYGQGIFEMLKAKKGEKILDLGCGTGDLTKAIADTGAIPLGMDASPEMIQTAKQKYPNIDFIEADAEEFKSNELFDAIFSNAALHWMKEAEKVILSIRDALAPGGRFVAEFGGKGNIQTLLEGIQYVLKTSYGISISSRNPWYFPSIGEYAQLLEKHGFHVVFAQHFNRPTVLEEGFSGLNHWLDSFADDFFPELQRNEREKAYIQIKDVLKPPLFKENSWVIDYKRLRIIAVKE